MEKIHIYAIYDLAGERYDTPVFMHSDIFAKRWFYKLVADRAGQLEHFKDDFELRRVGNFNVISGKIGLNEEKKIKTVVTGKQIGKEIQKNEKRNEA